MSSTPARKPIGCASAILPAQGATGLGHHELKSLLLDPVTSFGHHFSIRLVALTWRREH